MADETTAVLEPTLEQQLEQLRTPEEPTAQTPADPATPPTETQPSPETGEPTAVDPIEEKLNAIEDAPAEPEVKAPELTPEQQQILSIVPTPQHAQAMAETLNGYQAFTGAFASGDFTNVETMLEQWNPQATEAFREHLYEKYVKSGEWIDRWVAEKEGKATIHPVMRQLETKVQQLEGKLSAEEQRKADQERQSAARRVAEAYVGHVDALFNQIDFSPADRRWVMADINAKVSANPAVRAAINGGNPAAVNAIFKQAVRDYVTRDKAQTQQTQQTLQIQEKKKELVQTSPVTTLGALPDNIREVPKGKEDEWMEQQLAGLAKYKK